MRIVSAAQMRALEAAAFASGVSEAELQARAGRAVAEEVFRLIGGPGERVVVLVGHGNNGRDGALAAEWLLRWGTPVDVVLAPRHALTPDESTRLQAVGGSLVPGVDVSGIERTLVSASVAVDALVGIGGRGTLREPLAGLVSALNHATDKRGAALTVVALDIPSGIDADTGAVPGEAVRADLTVTLGGVKQGLLRFPAGERVGRLIACDIGLPSAAQSDLPYGVLTEADLAPLVPGRPLDAHKYRFGRVLAIAGSDHFPGAAVLCTAAAARVGTGLVTLVAGREVRLTVAAHTPEVIYTQVDVRAADGLAAAEALKPSLGAHTSVLLGPGLGRSDATTAFVHEVLRSRTQSCVVDADGLTALSHIDHWPSLLDPNVVLTPHSGELERLVGHKLSDAEPLWVHAGRLAQQWKCVLIAKGPFTCVADPAGHVDVWPRPNPGLATAGTGDVLAGVTAGFLAQGLEPWAAARLAVGVHALAAERVLASHQWRTLLASDLLRELPAVLARLTLLR